jgi:hypothetical protein
MDLASGRHWPKMFAYNSIRPTAKRSGDGLGVKRDSLQPQRQPLDFLQLLIEQVRRTDPN